MDQEYLVAIILIVIVLIVFGAIAYIYDKKHGS